MMRITNEKLKKHIAKYVKHKIPFTMRVTNQRVELRSAVGKYMNKESGFPTGELAFIKGVKQYIIKNELYKLVPNRYKNNPDRNKKIKYYDYNKRFKSGDFINNVSEVDLKSAYWEELNNTCPLSLALYEKGKTVSKKSRLAAVGSLAKTTEIIDFDGEKYIIRDPEKSLETEHVWYAVCTRIGKLMKDVSKACGKDFIFFWVDAMFVDDKSVEKVKRIFEEHGFKFSVDKCKYVQFQDKHLLVKGKGKWVLKNGDSYWSTERKFPYKPSGNGSFQSADEMNVTN